MLRFARVVLCFVLIGLLRPASAQKTVRIDSLPDEGIRLRTGWRWHPGDNTAWAKPDFDDSRWDTIQPSRNILRLPQLQKSPMGWLRLTFELDSSVAQTSISVQIRQFGASEVYIDGVLWLRLGQVGSNYQQEDSYTPAWERYLLPTLLPGRHSMAVRLSQHRPPWYMPKFWYSLESVFGITLLPTKGLVNQVANRVYSTALINYSTVGIFLMLSAIHFLYYFYRRQRVNLVFGLMALFGSSSFALSQVSFSLTHAPTVEWILFVQGMIVMLFMIFLLAAYYAYLNQPFSWLFWLIVAGLIIPKIYAHFFLSNTITSTILSASVVVLFFDSIRISVSALRSRRPNARFILNTLVVLVAVLVIGSLASYLVNQFSPAYSNYLGNVTNLGFFLVLPLSFAIILARDYQQTNRHLEEQLIEVEQLSAEKESILKAQNETLEKQVKERTTELTRSLTELRDTQQQLVQREKMASLGELTAGIAHEIQNPLNFVNNFADVSAELVEELREEREKGQQRDEELENEILTDLRQNLQKISQHGGRASSIVRGMLEHSRSSTGQREPTDINALVDEYMKLAYHGIRAKDKDGSTSRFNTQLVTHFDSGVGIVTVMPQELGRVLLNLFNNAFYAVQERAALEGAAQEKKLPKYADYQPTVTVTTKRMADTVEISVSDNGTGIPDALREKIFNPFFTTKPTGQGTGLGLSLSYDIITKGHSGTLTLESTAGQGTTFIIRLPAVRRQME